MPVCTVSRTHSYGRKLHPRDWATPVVSVVEFRGTFHADLNRQVDVLRAQRRNRRTGEWVDAFPLLYEPQLIAFTTERGMTFTGFEEVDGQRYYQGWYICWISEQERSILEGTTGSSATNRPDIAQR